MVLAFTSFKGGVGKSTLAQNIAVALLYQGNSVAIIDADSTASTLSWSEVRESNPIPTTHYDNPNGIAKLILQLNQQHDFVVVDCPPAIEAITTKVLLACDMAIVPIMPSGSDIWTTEKFLEHLQKVREQANVNVKLVINEFNPLRNFYQNFEATISDYAEAYGIEILENKIQSRVVFKEANANGDGVLEYNDRKATHEINSLLSEIL